MPSTDVAVKKISEITQAFHADRGRLQDILTEAVRPLLPRLLKIGAFREAGLKLSDCLDSIDRNERHLVTLIATVGQAISLPASGVSKV
jgi:hypothetical protein